MNQLSFDALDEQFKNWSELQCELEKYDFPLTQSIIKQAICAALEESRNSDLNQNKRDFLSFIEQCNQKDRIDFIAFGFALGMQWGSEVSKLTQIDNQPVDPETDLSSDSEVNLLSNTDELYQPSFAQTEPEWTEKKPAFDKQRGVNEYQTNQAGALKRETKTPHNDKTRSGGNQGSNRNTSGQPLNRGQKKDASADWTDVVVENTTKAVGNATKGLTTLLSWGKSAEPPKQKPCSNRYLLTILYADRLGNPCSIGQISQERVKKIVSQARFMKVCSDEKAAEDVLNRFTTSDEAIDYSQSINVVLLIEVLGTDDLLDARLSSEFELALNPDTNALATIIAVKRLESIAGVRQALHALV